MTHNGFIKGMAIGLMAGTAIGFCVTPKSNCAKKKTGRFLRTAGDIIENISSMWS